MRTLLFDLYDARRTLTRDRLYSTTVILTLALSIGATAAVFSIVDGILLRPMSYPDSPRLVVLNEIWHEIRDRIPVLEVNERHFEHWRAVNQTFESMAQYSWLPAHLTSGGNAAQIRLVRASGSLFDVLRVPAALGRTLIPDDERADAADVALVGHSLWQQRFGGAPSVIGTAIVIDGRAHTVVGVLPATLRLPLGTRLVGEIDAVVPLRVSAGWLGDHNNRAIGRLRQGVTIDQARAELDTLQQQVSAIVRAEAGEQATLSALVTVLVDSVTVGSRRGLLLLFAAVAAVLLMTCSNLANLALSRGVGRARDSAIRAALGASRYRLAQRSIIEHLALSLAAAVVAMGVAALAVAAFVRTAPFDLPRLEEVALNGRVMTFAALMGLLTGALVAILPTRRGIGDDVQTTLRSGGSAVASERAALRARQLLVTLQVATSVALLAVTGLVGTSLLRVLDIERGFSVDHVSTFALALPAARYPEARSQVGVYDRLLDGVGALPLVRSVTVASMLPLEGSGQVNSVVAEGANAPRSERPTANFRFIAPEFFTTLGIGIRRGRSFTFADRNDQRLTPAVISEPLATRLWPAQDPIGRQFSRGIEGEAGFEVVGVAADARYTTLEQTPPFMVYVPYWWRSRLSTSLLVRTAVDPASALPEISAAIRRVDPEIAVGPMRPLARVVDAALASRRYQARLFVLFGAVALGIATLGVYAVTAYAIARRQREMNIRVALGARTTGVLALIVGETTRPIAAGVAIGSVAAAAIGGALDNLLYEVSSRDPVIILASAASVGVVGVLTAFIAARHGLARDPMAALRVD